MKCIELLRVHPELRSRAPVVESIPIKCHQDLPMTRFGEMPHALFDVFLFKSASEQQQFLYRLNSRLVNA